MEQKGPIVAGTFGTVIQDKHLQVNLYCTTELLGSQPTNRIFLIV